jgi:hypothetical protein
MISEHRKEQIIGLTFFGSFFSFLIYHWIDIYRILNGKGNFGYFNILAAVITLLLILGMFATIYENIKDLSDHGGVCKNIRNYLNILVKACTYEKKDLMQDYTTAFELARYSSRFQSGKLSQDDDILNLKITSSFRLVHELADSSGWPMTPAAQRPEILSIRNIAGDAVAHVIAENSTMITLDDNYNEWYLTDAAKNKDVLTLRKKDGTSVAHQIISKQPKWINFYKPKHKEVLSLIDNDGVIIGQEMLKGSKTRSKLLLEFVDCGYLCKNFTETKEKAYSLHKDYHINEIVDFTKILFEKLDGAQSTQDKFSKLIYAYEIIKNIAYLYIHLDKSSELTQLYKRIEAEVELVFKKDPSLLQYAYNGQFEECENAFAIVKKYESGLIFGELSNTFNTVVEERNDSTNLPY